MYGRTTRWMWAIAAAAACGGRAASGPAGAPAHSPTAAANAAPERLRARGEGGQPGTTAPAVRDGDTATPAAAGGAAPSGGPAAVAGERGRSAADGSAGAARSEAGAALAAASARILEAAMADDGAWQKLAHLTD
ncbi:MAG: hypothetical protein D6689_06435, partial [Deltaproteobacteria bacterium]